MSNRQPIGWTWGPFNYVPYFGDYWYQPSLIGTLRETANSVNRVVNNPQQFSEQIVRGVIQGVNPPREENGEQPQLENTPPLLTRVRQILLNGVSGASATVLEQLLQNAQIIDPNDQENNLKNSCLQTLRHGREQNGNLQESATNVWNVLNERHIVFGGMLLNPKRSSIDSLRNIRTSQINEESDGTNPIEDLVRCQEFYARIRREHNLITPIEQSPSQQVLNTAQTSVTTNISSQSERENLVRMTDETIDRFCKKTIHFSTIYALKTLFNNEMEPNEILQQGGNIEERFLNRVGGGTVKQFFYRNAYRLIFRIIGPLIRETIQAVTSHLREFFNDDVTVLKFAETKIKDLANYYGRIERGREAFLVPPLPNSAGEQAGNFDEFLALTMRSFGPENLTERELIKRFEDYIVTHYTPIPAVAIAGHRIPILSKFISWVVHSLRKAVVRFFLKRSDLINSILTQGSGSAHHAQLGLKKILQNKLTGILEMLHRTRTRQVSNLSEGNSENVHLNIEMRKAQLITRELHQVIQQHSHNLLRFIDIQACNNNVRALRNLDNRINALTLEILEAVRNLFQWEPFSLQTILENATTNMIETSLLSIFDDKERQIESQMQAIFSVLENSYEYIPHDQRLQLELRYREESQQLDNTLNGLLEQLTRLSIESSIEDHLKNANVEKHQQTVFFIEQEKEVQRRFANYFTELKQQLTHLIENYDHAEHTAQQVRDKINTGIARIERYMNKIAATLRSKELENCYTDTKGDLFNCYAIQIALLESFAEETLTPLLKKIDHIVKLEERVNQSILPQNSLRNLSFNLLKNELDEELERIKESMPQGGRQAIVNPLNAISEQWGDLHDINHYLRLFQIKERLEEEKRVVDTNILTQNRVRNLLSEISLRIREYNTLALPNPLHQSEQIANQRRDQLYNEIEERRLQLLQIQDPSFTHLIDFLRVERTDDLYRVFFPPWTVSRRAPIFIALDRMRNSLLQQQNLLQNQIQEASVSLQNQVKNTLEEQKEERIQNLRETVRIAEEAVHNYLIGLIERLNVKFQELPILFDQLESVLTEEIPICTDALTVKGCIAVGELHFMNNKGLIIANITNQITSKINHLLDSLGKPFHYKQLVLRMVVQDIVNRERQ